MITDKEKLKFLAVVFASGAIFWAAFYPGFMSYDSIQQFTMAQSLTFNDWHPPLMSWVWSVAGFFFPGPSGMLAFHISLILISVYIWWSNFRERSFSWVIFLIPFLPWVVNFLGVLWKDVGLAFSLFALSGLALRAPTIAKMLLASVLVFYAINIRYNSILAVFPILMFLSYGWFNFKSSLKMIAFSCAVIVCCIYLGGAFNYGFLGAEKTKPLNYMMVDDLVYISDKNNESFLPDINIDEIKDCAMAIVGQNRFVGKIRCLSEKPSYAAAKPLEMELSSIWLSQIIKHPVDYFQFRVAAFSYLLRTPVDPPFYIWHPGVNKNPFGFEHSPNGLTLAAEKLVAGTAVAAPFFFKPYWWLLSSLLLLLITFLLVPSRTVTVVRVLLISSILYILGYLPLTPMADFRYIYWSVIASSLSFILVFIDWSGINSEIPRRRVVFIAVLALCFSVIILNHGRIAEFIMTL